MSYRKLLGAAPAFAAARITSVQTISTGVETKVEFNTDTETEDFDTTSDYDPVTNFRFTPSESGIYFLTSTIRWVSFVDAGVGRISIFKNGSVIRRGELIPPGGTSFGCHVSALVEANGTTDFFEVFVIQSTGSDKDVNIGFSNTFFMGTRVERD